MGIVTLVSGGIDSALMSVQINELSIEQYPIFINYGQLNFKMEYSACIRHSEAFSLKKPVLFDLENYGNNIPSGITNSSLDIIEDAFTPGRNLLFLLVAASYAAHRGESTIAIGLLKEETCIFPDQTDTFISKSQELLSIAVGTNINICTPLRDFYKKDVIRLAKEKKIVNYYSCHAGLEKPCGNCISCNEYK